MDEVSDERLQNLLQRLTDREGFCNNTVWADEARSLTTEVQRYRNRPAHCPGCDGDHL